MKNMIIDINEIFRSKIPQNQESSWKECDIIFPTHSQLLNDKRILCSVDRPSVSNNLICVLDSSNENNNTKIIESSLNHIQSSIPQCSWEIERYYALKNSWWMQISGLTLNSLKWFAMQTYRAQVIIEPFTFLQNIYGFQEIKFAKFIGV